MRTIFDQYVHPENRLTHALIASLTEDPSLLGAFLHWLDVAPPRGEPLHLVEQRLPGEADDRPETSESDTRRLPDAWIYTASGWALLIESKIAAPIDAAQLRGHLAIAERRGFTDVRLVVLSPNAPARTLPDRCQHRRWRDLYAWACAEAPRSAWATHLTRYMPVAEQRMVTDQYLQEGTLTTFTGIPFGAEAPYTYLEAKRLLRLLMADVRADASLAALGVDHIRGGRSSITGSAQTSVWDYLPFAFWNADEGFTRYPHVTLSIQRDRAIAHLALPDKLEGSLRRRLVSGGYEAFKAAIASYIERMHAVLIQAAGAVPFIEVRQRHYLTRQLSTLDAYLEFDPRTAFPGHGSIKRQEEWLRSTYDAFADKRSNLQIGIGAVFRYGASTTVSASDFARSVGAPPRRSWISSAMRRTRSRRRRWVDVRKPHRTHCAGRRSAGLARSILARVARKRRLARRRRRFVAKDSAFVDIAFEVANDLLKPPLSIRRGAPSIRSRSTASPTSRLIRAAAPRYGSYVAGFETAPS